MRSLVPPGGGIEKIDKSPRHCAQRELFEEAGWRLPLNRFSKIGRLEGYFGSARSEWQTARLKWIVHIYSVTVPPELKDGFICGDGFVKVRWFPIDCLPFHRMIDSDKVWLPQLVGPHHLVIKLMFDRKVGKLIRSELIPEYFGEEPKIHLRLQPPSPPRFTVRRPFLHANISSCPTTTIPAERAIFSTQRAPSLFG